MARATKHSLAFYGLVALAVIVIFGLRYAFLEPYLSAGAWGAGLFVVALCGAVLLAAWMLRPPVKATIGALALVAVVGLATAVAGPLPYELAKVADGVPVPSGAEKGQTVSLFNEPFSHNTATADYVYPGGTNATQLYEEAKRLLEADGWQITMANPPAPMDSSNPDGQIRAKGGGFWVLLHFTYGGTQGSPPIHLAVTASRP